MLELAILGALHDDDLHGYELKKRLTDEVGPLSSVSFGSLYPALRRMEKAGLVRTVTTPRRVTNVPASGSLSGELALFKRGKAALSGGRNKKVYAITDTGRERLFELLTDTADTATDGRLFELKVAFCSVLSGKERVALFERHKAALAERLAQVNEPTTDNRAPSAPNQYVRALHQRASRTMSNDLEWLDGLIAAEHASLSAGPGSP